MTKREKVPDVTGVVAEKDDRIRELEAHMTDDIADLIDGLSIAKRLIPRAHVNEDAHQYLDEAGTALTVQAARILELETVIKRYLADDFSCNGGAQRMFEAVIEGNPLELGVLSMIVDIITVNTPTKEFEVKDFPEHGNVTECISIARDEHPDWTSMVVVLVRGNNEEGR